jgi:precorrin-6B C5,15-methyltransferase / cobalt-precorrin-6B C5,C15-methyltransferase
MVLGVIEVVGIGAGGWESLGPAERSLLLQAEVVLGGRRHLDLLPAQAGQLRQPWPADLRSALPGLVAGHDHRRTVVLASGDPLVFGVGSTLIELFGHDQVRVHPAVSSVTLAAARMGWPYGTYEVLRITGDEVDSVRRHLAPARRLMILSRDGSTPGLVREALTEVGFGRSKITVLADLGTPAEARWDEPGPIELPNLNVACVTCVADRPSAAATLAPGLADEVFDHDGQLTKRDVRASALAHLMPSPGQLLWDVGAGAGSVGIEWCRIHPSCRAIAVERHGARAKRARLNAARLGVPELQVVVAEAPAALAELPAPDAIFLGGGASVEVIDCCWQALRPGGRLVMHAVTQQTETIMVEAWRRLGGGLTRIAIENMEPIGGYDGWKPARAVVQWSVQKPLDATGDPVGTGSAP